MNSPKYNLTFDPRWYPSPCNQCYFIIGNLVSLIVELYCHIFLVMIVYCRVSKVSWLLVIPQGFVFVDRGQRWEMKNVKLLALGAHWQENTLAAISTILCTWYQGGCNAFFDLGPQAKNVFWCEGFCWQENCVCFFQDWILGFLFSAVEPHILWRSCMYVLLVSAYFVGVKMITTIISIIQYSGGVGIGWNIPNSCIWVSLDVTISLGRF